MLKKILAQVLGSTNGTLNVVLFVLLALAASLNFPEETLESFFAGAIAFVGVVREWLKQGGIKFRWNANVFTYIAMAVLLFAPWLDDFMPALQGLINALIAGDTNMILSAAFAVINVLWHLFQDKPWKKPVPAT